jgi:hypothetical protein
MDDATSAYDILKVGLEQSTHSSTAYDTGRSSEVLSRFSATVYWLVEAGS